MGAPPPPGAWQTITRVTCVRKTCKNPFSRASLISLITVICMDPHSPNELIATRSLLQQNIVFSILGDPGAASWVDRMFVVKV